MKIVVKQYNKALARFDVGGCAEITDDHERLAEAAGKPSGGYYEIFLIGDDGAEVDYRICIA